MLKEILEAIQLRGIVNRRLVLEQSHAEWDGVRSNSQGTQSGW
jgi:hypothetical protein